jgi:hypothetical protein
MLGRVLSADGDLGGERERKDSWRLFERMRKGSNKSFARSECENSYTGMASLSFSVSCFVTLAAVAYAAPAAWRSAGTSLANWWRSSALLIDVCSFSRLCRFFPKTCPFCVHLSCDCARSTVAIISKRAPPPQPPARRLARRSRLRSVHDKCAYSSGRKARSRPSPCECDSSRKLAADDQQLSSWSQLTLAPDEETGERV